MLIYWGDVRKYLREHNYSDVNRCNHAQVQGEDIFPGGGTLVNIVASYSYLPDGTKLDVAGNGKTTIYMGAFTYTKSGVNSNWTLESISLPGMITVVNNGVYTPLSIATDHLGNVRALVDMSTGSVVERSDYYTYDGRITQPSDTMQAFPTFPANRWRLAGKEEQDIVTGLPISDFGARMYDPFTATWLTQDPMATDYPGIGPYVFCAGNPVNLVDRDGLDIWEVNPSGRIKWKEESDNDILYSVDNEGKRGNYIQIKNRQVLDAFNNNDTGTTYYTGDDQPELRDLFVFLSDNTTIEWALHFESKHLTLGTVHDSVNAGEWKMFGINNRPQSSIHSHPGYNKSVQEEAQTMAIDWKYIKNNRLSKAVSYYVYFPQSHRVYKLTEQGYTIVQLSSVLKNKF